MISLAFFSVQWRKIDENMGRERQEGCPVHTGRTAKGRPGVIKLNTNENPYPPAPGVAKALREFDVDGLRLYPDPTVGSLVEAIADNYGLDKSRVLSE